MATRIDRVRALWRAARDVGPTTAMGHVAAMVPTVACVVLRLPVDRLALQVGMAALVAIACVAARRRGSSLKRAGFALGSFAWGSAHGAGLALVPALMPLCASGGSPTGWSLATVTTGLQSIAMVAVLAVAGVRAARVVYVFGAAVIGASMRRVGWAAAISGTANSESPIARTRG